MSRSELDRLYTPIQKDLDAVYELMKDVLSDTSVGNIQEIVDHMMLAPGKQVRAALCLLSYYATPTIDTVDTQNIIKLAAVIELIHLASLIHDDIIDEAITRRNIDTVNTKFGSNSAIVMGVYVYAVALRLLSEIGRHDILNIMSTTVKTLCEGELSQSMDINTISIHTYLSMIRRKTGVLFESATLSALLLKTPESPYVEHYKNFGLNLGYIFQITDDYLDLFGSEESLGKEPGQDLLTGKITLPYIYLSQHINLDIQSIEDLKLVLTKDIIHNVKEKTKHTLNEFLINAKRQLDILEPTPYKKSLLGILELVFERISEKSTVRT